MDSVMKNKKASMDAIMQEILTLDDPKIDRSREKALLDFIDVTINGDIPEGYLVINADLENDEVGAIVYVVTNARVIKIDISDKDAKTYSLPLRSIVRIDTKLSGNNCFEFHILFPSDSFGLSYTSPNPQVTQFLQKIDELRLS